MKKPETTAAFVMICIVVLVAAYGFAYCINEIKASKIEAAQNKILKKEIKQIESYSPDNENTLAQNRNTRTGTGMGTQGFGQRNDMMGQARQMNVGSGNQGMNTRGTSMFGGSSAMGTQNFEQQSMSNNVPYIPDTQKKTEEPNNSNKQGGS